MNVAWIADEHHPAGGAELTQQAFRDVAPAHVRFTDPGTADVTVVHNCVTSTAGLIDQIAGRPVVRYLHDMWPHGDPALRTWLLEHARLVFCSELHRRWFPHDLASRDNRDVIPPAIDLQAFTDARQDEREGTIWVGHFTNRGKGIDLAVEWATRTRQIVDFYGAGPLAPEPGEFVRVHDAVAPEEVPALVGGAERLVFLPTSIEPFGRVVAEAWAAGCDVVTNRIVGATAYHEDRRPLKTATRDFWQLVTETAEC